MNEIVQRDSSLLSACTTIVVAHQWSGMHFGSWNVGTLALGALFVLAVCIVAVVVCHTSLSLTVN